MTGIILSKYTNEGSAKFTESLERIEELFSNWEEDFKVKIEDVHFLINGEYDTMLIVSADKPTQIYAAVRCLQKAGNVRCTIMFSLSADEVGALYVVYPALGN